MLWSSNTNVQLCSHYMIYLLPADEASHIFIMQVPSQITINRSSRIYLLRRSLLTEVLNSACPHVGDATQDADEIRDASPGVSPDHPPPLRPPLPGDWSEPEAESPAAVFVRRAVLNRVPAKQKRAGSIAGDRSIETGQQRPRSEHQCPGGVCQVRT